MIKIILLSVLGMIVCQPSLPGGWHKFGGHLGVNILLACKSKLESENFAVHDVIPMDPILEQVVAGYNYRFNATVEHVNHKAIICEFRLFKDLQQHVTVSSHTCPTHT